MQLHKRDVVDMATSLLDNYGIADLSMRRLARELNVSPGALYWHFANKQQLLGAVADRILQPLGEVDGEGARAVEFGRQPVEFGGGSSAEQEVVGGRELAGDLGSEAAARPGDQRGGHLSTLLRIRGWQPRRAR